MVGFLATAQRKKTAPEYPDLLPWAQMPAWEVMLNKDGALMSTLQYRGVDLDSATPEQVRNNAARVNNVLRRFPGGWGVYIEAARQEVNAYPDQQWPNAVGRLIAAERRQQFATPGAHYGSTYYLTVAWMPPPDIVNRLEDLLFTRPQEQERSKIEEAIDYFRNQVLRTGDLLGEAMEEVTLLQGADFLSYLAFTCNLEWQPVAMPECAMFMDYQLGTAKWKHGTTPVLHDVYLRTVTIRRFPNASYAGMLDALTHLQFPYRWVNRYVPYDKEDAEKHMRGLRRRWWSARCSQIQHLSVKLFGSQPGELLDNPEAVSKKSQLDEALEASAEAIVSFGQLTTTVTVWDRSYKAAEEQQRQVEQVLKAQGYTLYDERLNASEAFLGSIPGNFARNPRRPILHSMNLVHMMPTTAIWQGTPWDEHLKAPAILRGETSGQTPFDVVLHERGVGHAIIVGPTGSGKTVLLGLMAEQFQQYPGHQIFPVDKKQGLRGMTMACGGEHYMLGRDTEALDLQPLRWCDEEQERRWGASWVEGVIAGQGVAMTPALRAEIWKALCILGTAPVQERTLTVLHSLFQMQDLRQAIEPFTLRGAYGHCLDAAEDTLRLADWCCFEMDALFALPQLVAPTLSYLFHALSKRFDGRPTFLPMDEAWKYLSHPLFMAMIEEWLRELRKLNVSVVFSTQDLSELLESPIASIILNSCPVRIFLPNNRATEETAAEAYRRLNLNDRQLELLAMATPQQDYYYMSNEGSRMFQLALGPVAKVLCTFGSPADIQQMDAWKRQPPEEGVAAAMLRYRGMEKEAEQLLTLV